MTTNDKTLAGRKVTICFVNSDGFGFGVSVVEAKLTEHGRGPWAQYPDVPHIDFIPKGARRERRWQGSYRPYAVVLDGWNLGVKIDPFEPAETTASGLAVSKGRYMSSDPRWVSDQDALIAAKGCKVLVDYRERQA